MCLVQKSHNGSISVTVFGPDIVVKLQEGHLLSLIMQLISIEIKEKDFHYFPLRRIRGSAVSCYQSHKTEIRN